MGAFEYIGITIVVVVAETLIFAGYVVHTTRCADGLAAIGQMVAQIVAAFGQMVAQIVAAFMIR